jgi:hypothetical protein
MVTVASSSTAETSGGTTIVIPAPSSIGVGDYLFVLLNGNTQQTPDGWTVLGSNGTVPQIVLYAKIADASDAIATDFTFTGTNNSTRKGALLRITGGPSSAIATVSLVSTTSSTRNPSFVNGVTPIRANSLMLLCIRANSILAPNSLDSIGITTDDPGGWSLIGNESGDSQRMAIVAHALRASTSDTGTYTCNLTSDDTTNSWAAYAVAIEPSGSSNRLTASGRLSATGRLTATGRLSASGRLTA